jgi:hypothetical protein
MWRRLHLSPHALWRGEGGGGRATRRCPRLTARPPTLPQPKPLMRGFRPINGVIERRTTGDLEHASTGLRTRPRRKRPNALWLADPPQDWNNTKRDRVVRVPARRAEHPARAVQRQRPRCTGALAHLGTAVRTRPKYGRPAARDRGRGAARGRWSLTAGYPDRMRLIICRGHIQNSQKLLGGRHGECSAGR